MRAIIKKYSNKHHYELDYPEETEVVKSIQEALDICKENISKVRGTTAFLGYRICDQHGRIKHKLPSY